MPYSKERRMEYDKEHYKNNREKKLKYEREIGTPRRTKRRRELKSDLVKYKGGKCEHCNVSYPYDGVYEFHHPDPNKKDYEISLALDRKVPYLRSRENLLKEIDKCLMLCANCHRMEHARLKGELDEQRSST